METIQVEKRVATMAYHKADKSGKQLLKDVLGIDFKDNPREYVRVFGDVCQELGYEASDFRVPESGTAEHKAAMYLKRLKLIAEVFNQGWQANMADVSQYKYYPWFNVIPDQDKPSGFGLSCDGYGFVASGSYLGARPYFKDRETAMYVGKQFLSEFEGWAQQTSLSM